MVHPRSRGMRHETAQWLGARSTRYYACRCATHPRWRGHDGVDQELAQAPSGPSAPARFDGRRPSNCPVGPKARPLRARAVTTGPFWARSRCTPHNERVAAVRVHRVRPIRVRAWRPGSGSRMYCMAYGPSAPARVRCVPPQFTTPRPVHPRARVSDFSTRCRRPLFLSPSSQARGAWSLSSRSGPRRGSFQGAGDTKGYPTSRQLATRGQFRELCESEARGTSHPPSVGGPAASTRSLSLPVTTYGGLKLSTHEHPPSEDCGPDAQANCDTDT